jgi:hypothetical protein
VLAAARGACAVRTTVPWASAAAWERASAAWGRTRSSGGASARVLYSKALEYKYRVKTVVLDTLKRYSIFSLTLYLE